MENVTFFEENAAQCLAISVCASVSIFERPKSDYRPTFDGPRAPNRNTEPQQCLTFSLERGGEVGVLESLLEGFILVMVIGLLVWK